MLKLGSLYLFSTTKRRLWLNVFNGFDKQKANAKRKAKAEGREVTVKKKQKIVEDHFDAIRSDKKT